MNRRLFIKQGAWLASAVILDLFGSVTATAAPRRSVSSLPAKLPNPKPHRVIVVDPGHGGADPGATGRSGIREKSIVLAITEDFAHALERETGATVRLTRERDIFLPLEERVDIAQSLQADLFLSIHADFCPVPGARGLSVYTLSEGASDKLSAVLADRENRVDTLYGLGVKHVDKAVASILFDLARRETLNRSLKLQHHIVDALSGKTRLLEHPARSANFAVLRSPSVPAMLIETGFLSNVHDEALLSTQPYRHRLATMLAQVIAAGFQRQT